LRISDRSRGRCRYRRRLCLFLLSKPVHVEDVPMGERDGESGRDEDGYNVLAIFWNVGISVVERNIEFSEHVSNQ
jgi:hypothetical protein